jgi:hypothetical protein
MRNLDSFLLENKPDLWHYWARTIGPDIADEMLDDLIRRDKAARRYKSLMFDLLGLETCH